MTETVIIPAAADVERSILGSILQDPDHYYGCHRLSADDFGLDSHRRIFRRFALMADGSRAIDLLTLQEELRSSHELDAVGGTAYLCSLTEGIPRRQSLNDWIGIVIDKSRLRRLQALAQRVEAECADGRSSDQVASTWEASMLSMLDNSDQDDALVSAYTVKTLDAIETQRKRPAGILGLSYGVAALDDFTAGAVDGEVTVIGARPGIGKTTLLIQATVAACSAGVPVVLFSYEMNREQLLRRIYSHISGVVFPVLRDPRKASISEMEQIRAAALKVAEWPLRVYDDADISLQRAMSIARLCIRKHGVRLIGMDYAQIVPHDARDDKSRVSAVAHAFARTIKHEHATGLLLSQLRKPSNADGYSKPPHSSDLRETGAIEDVAHVVLLLHRPWDPDEGRIANSGQIIVAKQRSGDTGAIDIGFNRQFVRFE